MDDKEIPPVQPLPDAAFGDRIGLLGNNGPSSARLNMAMEPKSYYRSAHSRTNSSIDAGQSPYEAGEPPAYQMERRGSTEPSSASSMLRKLTTKVKPMSMNNFRSIKRPRGRQYATLDDGETDSPAVDISSLEGMGWEMTDMSAHPTASLRGQDTEYLPNTSVNGKPAFREFVEKRRTVGDGMRDIGVQLRRDPTKLVRRRSGQPSGHSSGIDRTKTVRELGQNLAQEKNMIVEVEEPVDLSSLAGGEEPDNRASQLFDSVSARRSTAFSQEKSYFFPEDPDIPNWKPWSMSSTYILCLTALSLGLAGSQEYLCQRSIKEAKNGGGILAFNEVSEISTWDFFAWKYLPTMIAIVFAVLFSIMDFDIRRLEPFYQLSQPGGAKASSSLNLDHLTMFQYFVPFKAFRLRQWAVLFSTTGNIVASMVAPALQNPSITFETNKKCEPNGCADPEKDTRYWVRVSGVYSRLLSASYVVIAIILVILFIQLRRKSGLLSDPKGIAGIASMATKSHILQDFAGTDEANLGKIHKRLQHRRYVLYKSSIWQGEWSSASERFVDSERKLTSPHPMMLRTSAAVPFLLFMVFCLAAVPLITLTPARIVPNSAPWLPIVVATGLKLFFSTFEADVRLMEPFFVLSEGNATPQNSLTLDYQSAVYGIMPLKALFNKHYLVALVGFASISLDILTVTVSSFSVDSQAFMHLNVREDLSNGDETYVSFWASLILSITILVYVIFTTALVYARRRHPFLPREPSTIAAVLAFIYSSNMLTDFIDTETLNNKQMETRLKSLGKRYGLGWFRGRDGQVHCAIDEEPMKSRYVHGKSYAMAQSGPLQPAETFYAV